MKKSYELYLKLITEQGLSSYAVAMKARVPQTAFSLWKTKGVVPKMERMARIAEALSTPNHEVSPLDFYRADIAAQGEEK